MKTVKKIFLLIPILALFTLVAARCAPPKGGITFYESNWQQVLDKAKAEHKLIFLDIYASWCGPCKMLKRQTFVDKDAAAYFNANFINASFDGEVGDGVMLAQQFRIEAYPSLFILDANGKVVKSSVGFISADELIDFGKQAAKSKK